VTDTREKDPPKSVKAVLHGMISGKYGMQEGDEKLLFIRYENRCAKTCCNNLLQRGYVFTRLSVCLSVCLSLSVCWLSISRTNYWSRLHYLHFSTDVFWTRKSL